MFGVMQLSHNIPLILVWLPASVAKENMLVTYTARIGRWLCFFIY